MLTYLTNVFSHHICHHDRQSSWWSFSFESVYLPKRTNINRIRMRFYRTNDARQVKTFLILHSFLISSIAGFFALGWLQFIDASQQIVIEKYWMQFVTGVGKCRQFVVGINKPIFGLKNMRKHATCMARDHIVRLFLVGWIKLHSDENSPIPP